MNDKCASTFTGLEPLHLLRILQACWTKREIHELPEEARRGFASLADPLEGLLIMLENCNDWKKGKKQSLAHYLIDQFNSWIKDNASAQQPCQKQNLLQAKVFALLTVVPTNVLDPLVSLFEVDKADTSSLLSLIEDLCIKNKYKEAVVLSIKLNLQSHLNIEEMCIPLLLQDDMSLVEVYVDDYPELQGRLLQALDSLCYPIDNTRSIQRHDGKLSRLRCDKLNYKVLSKLVFRLMERYGLGTELCPNVVNQHCLASIKYLLHKHFVEKTITEENWAEHIEGLVGQNTWLQIQFIGLLGKYTDLDTVAHWALRLNVPQEKLPQPVAKWLKQLEKDKGYRTGLEKSFKVQSLEEKEKKRNFYQLPIPTESIHIVEHLEQLTSCASRVLQAGGVVGIDMEWRPTFTAWTKARVSILQIALKDHVYLLDLPQLVKESESPGRELEFAQFIQSLFSNRTITKLGYALAGDLRSLCTSYPVLKDVAQITAGMLDLLNMQKELLRAPVHRQDYREAVDVLASVENGLDSGCRQREKGLSLLVQYVLGKPLDKTEQLSNWERRPLRLKQIIYAAADAYCLLDLYEVLHQEMEHFRLSHSPENRLKSKVEKKRKENKPKQSRSCANIPSQDRQSALEQIPPSSPVSPTDFRVICDNMLQGLGRYLRCVGVDVKILANEDDHRMAAEIAREEDRVILTCGLPFQTLRSQVQEGRCLSVNCSDKAKNQAIHVLKHFNVQVTPRDIFSRCQLCNGSEYLKLSVEEMAQAVQLNAAAGKTETSDTPSTESVKFPSQGKHKALPQIDPGWPGICSYSPNCHWAERSGLNMKTLKFTSGATLQVSTIPPGILDKVTRFYCCTTCGKVFWEGSHFRRVLSQFQEVLRITNDSSYLQM
ncbi:exonuclease mut-7 homolog isoform X1 [Amblyraja radiata]|uniref:exonuclease mut-7 homolog isoform X1 n=1 Tax=Amblyraja radiata TaxID=386614 RepID=UPI001403154E|nr:exonuclease mut-7 homolog isoform X1 [Amblyraja radiata]XP_032904894.1 exonuclease mut-7 homolog isoform X1 [Amblyraja radiata]